MMPGLFDPVTIGALELPNRVIMAPLTRMRAHPDGVPSEIMADYYRQRAGAGLIIGEATSILPMAVGIPNAPGIWTDAQIAGWSRVTDAVHAAGGRIYCQLQHVGHKSHSSYLGGDLPVSASNVPALGNAALVRPKAPHEVPRALALEELAPLAESYGAAARNALAAGFDGVELHGAHGYLLDQFLQDSTNTRTDGYGGSIAARARMLLEAVDACCAETGADRVAVNLSPRGIPGTQQGSDMMGTVEHVARELGRRGLAFLFLRGGIDRDDGLAELVRDAFAGPVILNDAIDKAKAQAVLASGLCHAVAFGQDYIANPDLVWRLAIDAPLTAADPATIYASGPQGYCDYPALAEIDAARSSLASIGEDRSCR